MRAGAGERGEEVDGGAGADDALVVLRAGLEPLGGVGRRGLELGRVELLEERLAAPEDADVRAVELVGGAGEEVGAERGDVDEGVRGVVDGVHEHERAGGVGEIGGAPHVVDRAERVRGGADREELVRGPSAAARSSVSSWPVSGRKRTVRTARPCSRASRRHGSTLAW